MKRNQKRNPNVYFSTFQAEGCRIESWGTHEGTLKDSFSRLVEEVRAQQQLAE